MFPLSHIGFVLMR